MIFSLDTTWHAGGNIWRANLRSSTALGLGLQALEGFKTRWRATRAELAALSAARMICCRVDELCAWENQESEQTSLATTNLLTAHTETPETALQPRP